MESASGCLLKHTKGILHVALLKLDVTSYNYAINSILRSDNSTNIKKNRKFFKNEPNTQQHNVFSALSTQDVRGGTKLRLLE
jgi:hypothetical protein